MAELNEIDFVKVFLRDYTTRIRPELKQENPRPEIGIIIDACILRFGYCERNYLFSKPEMYEQYKSAITYLQGLGGNIGKMDKKAVEEILNSVELAVGKLELMVEI